MGLARTCKRRAIRLLQLYAWVNFRAAVLKQVHHVDIQCASQSFQAIQRDVRDATFQLRHIGSVEVSKLCHCLLAQATLFA